MKRRDFLGALSSAVAGTTLLSSVALENVLAAAERTAHLSPQQAAMDESLWREVQNAFSINRSIVNLDNGNVSPSPRNVTEAMVRARTVRANGSCCRVRRAVSLGAECRGRRTAIRSHTDR
jgi:hypothetical protein